MYSSPVMLISQCPGCIFVVYFPDESTEQFLGLLLLGMVFCLLGAAASGYWIKKFKQNQASPTPAFSKMKNDYFRKSDSSDLGHMKSLIITIDKVSNVSLAKATAVTHSMVGVK